MSLERLEAELARIRAGSDPDRWALAAYRVAVARSEAAAGDLDGALKLLERAGRILTEARAPVEHARICTAAGNCHRRLGRPDRAAPLFKQAADLVQDRAPAGERAAALVNLGLALTETGRPEAAIEPLGQAVDILAGAADPESRRVQAAALINRAQALQAQGGAAELEKAVADYRSAAACADEDTPQRGMALHGLGSALLESIARDQAGGAGGLESEGVGEAVGGPGGVGRVGRESEGVGAVGRSGGASGSGGADAAGGGESEGVGGAVGGSGGAGGGDGGLAGRIDEAISAFEQALGVLTEAAFPFQHAIARHSLAVAWERRGGPMDSARALAEVEAAMSIFDPRLHRPQWQAAADTLARLERKLEIVGPPKTRADHFARLLAAVSTDERARLLRDRLQRLATTPEIRCRRDLDELAAAFTRLGSEEHEAVEHEVVEHEAVGSEREHEAEHEAAREHEAVEYETVMRSMIPVLMELPDLVLDSACASLAAAHRASGRAEVFDETLDRVIHDLLHGPQRVRVRDLLTAAGWVRP